MTEIVYTGTDGSVWDLKRGPVRLSTGGLKGLGMPDFSDQVRETALQDGQTLLGYKAKPRTVWLPLKFKGAAEFDVAGVQRSWWAACAYGLYATLTVTDDLGGVRTLSIRFQDDGGIAYSLDPSVQSDAFGLTFIADQPWWQGPAQSSFYTQAGTTHTFFGDGAGATPFYIIPATSGAARTIANPGNIPAWVKWTLDPPMTAFRAGVNGHYVGGPIGISAGHELVVETDPLRQLATLDGTTIVTRQLTEIDWAPIPAKATATPLDLSVTGTGLITATITPRYARAL